MQVDTDKLKALAEKATEWTADCGNAFNEFHAACSPQTIIALLAENEWLKDERFTETVKESRWTCFHCGETFTDRGKASVHFGPWPENVNHPRCCPQGLRRDLHDARSVLLTKDVEIERLRSALQRIVDLRTEAERAEPLVEDTDIAAIVVWQKRWADAFISARAALDAGTREGEKPHE